MPYVPRSAALVALLSVIGAASSCSLLVPAIDDDGPHAPHPRADAGHVRDGGGPPGDAGPPLDGGALPDGALPFDAGDDAGEPDASEPDAGEPDAGEPDAGLPDAGRPDAGLPDAGLPDAGLPDAGPPSDLPLGATCTAPGECASGHCADGVCCSAACDGECEACGDDGTCGISQGAVCESAPLACGDFVHGLEDGSCYRNDDVVIPGTCSPSGTCVNDVTRCEDVARGPAIVECDLACTRVPWGNSCLPGTPVEHVTLDGVCVLDEETADCQPTCAGPSGPGGTYRAIPTRMCEHDGRCRQRNDKVCGRFICEEQESGPVCLTACQSDGDCVQPADASRYCSLGACVVCTNDAHCGALAVCRADGTCGPKIAP